MATKQVSDSFAYALNNVPDVAKPVVGTSRDAPDQKQGHKCCAGCCDVRRAVIIVNIINLIFGTLAFVGILVGRSMLNNPEQYQDAGVDEEVIASIQSIPFVAAIIISIIRLLITIGGIMGAIQYNYILVAVCGIAYVLDTVMALVGLNFLGALISGLFAYPHFFLTQEIKQGIMTKENYHNVEHSCCCV